MIRKLCAWGAAFILSACPSSLFAQTVLDFDIDGDGINEILVESVPLPSSNDFGQVEIKSGADGSLLSTIFSEELEDLFGLGATTVSDLNGDGIAEIAIPALAADYESDRPGKIHIYSGSNQSKLFTIKGARNEQLGWRVAPAIDMNDDGINDIIVQSAEIWELDVLVDTWCLYSGLDGTLIGRGYFPEQWWTQFALPASSVGKYKPTPDVNKDGKIDINDIIQVSNALSQNVEPASENDIVVDGKVDSEDVQAVTGAVLSGAEVDSFTEAMRGLSTFGHNTSNFFIGGLGGGGSASGSSVVGFDLACLLDRNLFRRPPLQAGALTPAADDVVTYPRSPIPDECLIYAWQKWVETNCGRFVLVFEQPGSVAIGEPFEVSAYLLYYPNEHIDEDARRYDVNPLLLEWGIAPDSAHLVDYTEERENGRYFYVDPSDSNPGSIEVTLEIGGDFTWIDCEIPAGSTLVEASRCSTFLTEAPVITHPGESHIVSTYAFPQGGTYEWEIVSGADYISHDNVLDGSTFNFTSLDQFGLVTLRSTYTTSNNGMPCQEVRTVHFAVYPECDIDSDDDGASDCCEAIFDTGDSDISLDSDQDGLFDALECTLGTNPYYLDSDNDGLPDGIEWEIHQIDPLAAHPLNADTDDDGTPDSDEDFDGDGLSNFDEIQYGTDIMITDTDGDGVSDGTEVSQGSNPADDFDGGYPPRASDMIRVLVQVEDFVPYASGTYTLHVGPYSVRTYRTTPGQQLLYLEKGKQYDVRLEHNGQAQDVGCYHYSASITCLDGACCEIDDPSNVLSEHYTYDQNGLPLGESATLCIKDCEDDDSGGGSTDEPANVEFKIDLRTHLEGAEELMVLPGDMELVRTELEDSSCDEASESPVVRYEVADESIAKIRINGELVGSIDGQAPPDELEVVGLEPGTTTITAYEDVDGGEALGSITVKVGGKIRLAYTEAPTFVPTSNFGGSTGHMTGETRGPIPNDIYAAAMSDITANRPTVRIQVVDADGNPKPNKEVAVLTKNGYLEISESNHSRSTLDIVRETDGDGYLNIGIEMVDAPSDIVLDSSLSQYYDEIGILVGESSLMTDFNPEDFFNSEPHVFSNHTFTGNALKFEDITPGLTPLSPIPVAGAHLRIPIQNALQMHILEQHLERTVYRDDQTGVISVFEQLTISVWNPDNGLYQNYTYTQDFIFQEGSGGNMSYMDLLNQHTIPNLDLTLTDLWNNDLMNITVDTDFDEFVFDIAPPDEDVPGEPKLITAAAVAAEFGLGFVPGWDVIDAVRFGLFRNIDDDGAHWSNYVIAAAATAGLAADAGYLAGGIPGLAGNAITSAIKVIVKKVPPELIEQMVKRSDDAMTLVRELVDYLSKYPKPQGFAWTNAGMVKDWAIDMAAGTINSWNKILHSPLKFDNADLAQTVSVIGRKTTQRTLSEAGTEGVAAVIKYAGGESQIDDLVVALQRSLGASEAADQSLDNVMSAVQKTLRRNPAADGTPSDLDLQRVSDAIQMAKASPTGYSGVLSSFVGQDKIIKSVEEWNALKSLPAESLTSEQVVAINQIVESIWSISEGTSITRVVPLNGTHGGLAMVQNNNSTFAGFFARTSDIADVTDTTGIMNRLRLDYTPAPLLDGSPYARIRTVANSNIANSARLPRDPAFSTGHAKEELLDGYDYPFSGKGVPTSLDGHTMPEFKTASGEFNAMSAGDDMFGQPLTVMEFRFADGTTPYPQTITINGVPTTASDWKLIPDPVNPEQTIWAPLP